MSTVSGTDLEERLSFYQKQNNNNNNNNNNKNPNLSTCLSQFFIDIGAPPLVILLAFSFYPISLLLSKEISSPSGKHNT
jgi:hypothetical protein